MRPYGAASHQLAHTAHAAHRVDRCDLQQQLERELRKREREHRHRMHRAVVLAQLADAINANRECRSAMVTAAVYSTMPVTLHEIRNGPVTKAHVSRVLRWFTTNFYRTAAAPASASSIDDREAALLQCATKRAGTPMQLAQLLVAAFASVDIQARLVVSLRPPDSAAMKHPKAPRAATASSCSEQWPPDRDAPLRRRLIRSNSESDDGGEGSDKQNEHGMSDCNAWTEAYVDDEQQWLCASLFAGTAALGEPDSCEMHAAQPLLYAIGLDGQQHIRDITERYAQQWPSRTRRLRAPGSWWADALAPYAQPAHTELARRETEALEAFHRARDLPRSICDYKNHPLYALERHLLKFEAVYPPDSAIGTVRGEKVYLRSSVHTLRSRERWLHEARVVPDDERPYKVVLGRPSLDIGERKDVPLYGIWQTRAYEPPVAQNGRVPRNQYGNVDLFQDSMLPVGCVHMLQPGLGKIARQLGVDFAPAVRGFDFHGGRACPVTEGIVVCAEARGRSAGARCRHGRPLMRPAQFQDVLLDAWRESEAIHVAREYEQRRRELFLSWRRLVRRMMLRAKLESQFGPAAVPTAQRPIGAEPA